MLYITAPINNYVLKSKFMSHKRKNYAQIQMVERGLLTMYGCKDKLCLTAQIKLVEANRPKMLEAYNYKLDTPAERLMIERGFHQLLKVYRFELDEQNQILLALSNHKKLISAYRFPLCPKAQEILQKNKKA